MTRYASIVNTVDLNVVAPARAYNALARPGALLTDDELGTMGLSSANLSLDSVSISPDGLSLRRITTYELTPEFELQFVVSNAAAPNYTVAQTAVAAQGQRKIEATTGVPTRTSTYIYRDAATLFVYDLVHYWRSDTDVVGSPVSAWTSLDGVTVASQGIVAQQPPIAMDERLAFRLGIGSDTPDAGEALATPAEVALPQPWAILAVAAPLNTAAGELSGGLYFDGVSNFSTDGGGTVLPGAPPNANTANWFAGVANGTDGALWVNGAKSPGDAGAGTPTGFVILNALLGGANVFYGTIADLLVIDRVPTDDELAEYANYAAGWYGANV